MSEQKMTEAELAEWQYEHQEKLDAEGGELVQAEIAEGLIVSSRAPSANRAGPMRGNGGFGSLQREDTRR